MLDSQMLEFLRETKCNSKRISFHTAFQREEVTGTVAAFFTAICIGILLVWESGRRQSKYAFGTTQRILSRGNICRWLKIIGRRTKNYISLDTTV